MYPALLDAVIARAMAIDPSQRLPDPPASWARPQAPAPPEQPAPETAVAGTAAAGTAVETTTPWSGPGR